MTSYIALLVCVAGIMTGFVLEKRGRRDRVTAVAWLPWFWMTICATRSLAQWLGVGQYKRMFVDDTEFISAGLNGSPVDRNVLSVVIVLGVIILIKRRGAIARLLQDNKAILLFVLYLGLTVLWSDIEGASFRRWVRLVGH